MRAIKFPFAAVQSCFSDPWYKHGPCSLFKDRLGDPVLSACYEPLTIDQNMFTFTKRSMILIYGSKFRFFHQKTWKIINSQQNCFLLWCNKLNFHSCKHLPLLLFFHFRRKFQILKISCADFVWARDQAHIGPPSPIGLSLAETNVATRVDRVVPLRILRRLSHRPSAAHRRTVRRRKSFACLRSLTCWWSTCCWSRSGATFTQEHARGLIFTNRGRSTN